MVSISIYEDIFVYLSNIRIIYYLKKKIVKEININIQAVSPGIDRATFFTI